MEAKSTKNWHENPMAMVFFSPWKFHSFVVKAEWIPREKEKGEMVWKNGWQHSELGEIRVGKKVKNEEWEMKIMYANGWLTIFKW